MKTNVRSYTDKQLLNRVLDLDTFTHYPTDYWLIAVRSDEDEYNKFDDKFYLFKGTQFVAVYSGTTNTGAKGLKEFDTYNPDGAAVLKADTIVYRSHKRGLSKGRPVYRQYESFPYFRDNNKNNKAEEIGEERIGVIHAHIHDVKMGNKDEYKEYINGWSLACMVLNNGAQWHEFFNVHTKDQDFITLCILNEFEP